MNAALLAIWNRIAPDRDAEFNAWYEDEHLAERLAVPGFRTARRYRAVDDPYAYCALYELDAIAVLQSAAYLERLAHPTARTQAIMPHFADVSRAACSVAFDSAPGAPAYAWLALLAVPHADAPASRAAPAGIRLRMAIPDPSATGGPTPEQRLRPEADRLPSPFLLAEGEDRVATAAVAASLQPQLAHRPVRMFELIAARGSKG